MAISLDELNATHVPADIFTDRWIFQLVEEFRGPNAGVMFDVGRSVEPVDYRTFRKFVCNYGRSMIGAIRVVGEPVELGDCTALRKSAGLSEPEPSEVASEPEPAEEDAAKTADDAEEPASDSSARQPSDAPRGGKGNRR